MKSACERTVQLHSARASYQRILCSNFFDFQTCLDQEEGEGRTHLNPRQSHRHQAKPGRLSEWLVDYITKYLESFAQPVFGSSATSIILTLPRG
jgi:hypothetical protein